MYGVYIDSVKGLHQTRKVSFFYKLMFGELIRFRLSERRKQSAYVKMLLSVDIMSPRSPLTVKVLTDNMLSIC
jgi:hypothetical protein